MSDELEVRAAIAMQEHKTRRFMVTVAGLTVVGITAAIQLAPVRARSVRVTVPDTVRVTVPVNQQGQPVSERQMRRELDARRKDVLCAADYRDATSDEGRRDAINGYGPRMYPERGWCTFVTADSVAFKR